MWKDFFYFSKRERRGLVILLVFIAGIFLGKYLFTPKPLPPVEEWNTKDKQEETRQTHPEETRITPSYSTPYEKPYRPYQKKDNQAQQRTYYSSQEKTPTHPKSVQYPAKEKIKEGTTIDLNQCDTTELMKIPGIGSSFAKRIVGYRNLLGGFYRVEQLQEVYGMYEELYRKIIPYLVITSDPIRTISVNSASIAQLKSHPYINFFQAKAIVDIRKKRGKIISIDELSLLEEFSSEDRERIYPYLTLE